MAANHERVGPMSGDYISRHDAVERLAERLYLKMERMDPTRNCEWDELNEDERDFYRKSIEEILLEKTLLSLAMRDSKDSPTTT